VFDIRKSPLFLFADIWLVIFSGKRKSPRFIPVGFEILEFARLYVRRVLLISTHDGMRIHMSMVNMHMAMAIATVVEVNIHDLDT
jgi:hypothetical protein